MAAWSDGAGRLRRRTVLALAVAAIGLAGAARTEAGPAPVDLQVVDRDSRRQLPLWRHGGRLYVAGTPGHRYGLRVTNQTDRRVLVVMSVDGVNIVSGETAGYDQRGYIFAPYESDELDGWRKSLTEVADFTFTRLPNSYAARTGRPANVGVIGVAVFYEKAPAPIAEATPEVLDRGAADQVEPRPAPPPLAQREAPAPSSGANRAFAGGAEDATVTAHRRAAPSQSVAGAVGGSNGNRLAEAERRDEKLGTGHGAREWQPISIEPFERATSYPAFTLQIAYDTREHLIAQGVIPAWRYGERGPRPFPASPEGGPFVPDPPDDP